MKRRFLWALILTVAISGFTAYMLLDTFVIAKNYAVVDQNNENDNYNAMISRAMAQLTTAATDADFSEAYGSSGDSTDTWDTVSGSQPTTAATGTGSLITGTTNVTAAPTAAGNGTAVTVAASVTKPTGTTAATGSTKSGAANKTTSGSVKTTKSSGAAKTTAATKSTAASTVKTSATTAKPTTAATATKAATTAATTAVGADWSYKDADINIQINKYNENGAVFYVADIQLSSMTYFKTAFAKNTYGRNVSQTVSQMAPAHNAIFAVNGDDYGTRDQGLVIRNGTVYRDSARPAPDNQALLFDALGNMSVINESNGCGQSLVNSGIVQGFTFGPALILNGQVQDANSVSPGIAGLNPRNAIGEIAPLHYIIIIVDGRSSVSAGMTFDQLTNEFVKRGCSVAYNMDGGGSAEMWFQGNILNVPNDGTYMGERKISDIIYIGR